MFNTKTWQDYIIFKNKVRIYGQPHKKCNWNLNIELFWTKMKLLQRTIILVMKISWKQIETYQLSSSSFIFHKLIFIRCQFNYIIISSDCMLWKPFSSLYFSYTLKFFWRNITWIICRDDWNIKSDKNFVLFQNCLSLVNQLIIDNVIYIFILYIVMGYNK